MNALLAPAVVVPEARPLPSLEEFARFLLDRDHAYLPEARHAQRRLLVAYAAVWGNYEGIPNAVAQQQAEALFDSLTLTADEQQAEADFSRDDETAGDRYLDMQDGVR